MKMGLQYLDNELEAIRKKVDELNEKVAEIQNENTILDESDMNAIIQELNLTFNKDDSESGFSKVIAELNKTISDAKTQFENYFETGSRGMELVSGLEVSDQDVEDALYFVMNYNEDKEKEDDENGSLGGAGKDGKLGVLQSVDTEKLMGFIRDNEKWRDLIFQTRYELGYLYGIQTICSDNTVKVRRLLKNFREKMEDVEKQVWDDRHQLKDNFSFTGIASAGIFDIILLHDWYACNAPRKTYIDMGFATEDEFMEFRKRCNKIAYNLRKNQYIQMLEIDKNRLQ